MGERKTPEFDEEIVLAAAGDTVVGICRIDERERVGKDLVGRLGVWMVGMATVAAEEVDITATILWPLPLPLLGLGGIGVLEVVGTADVTATLVCPVTI